MPPCPWINHSATAIRTMRRAGLSDMLIASIIQDIRADAIAEERLRLEVQFRNNPPTYPTTQEIAERVAQYAEMEA